MMRHDKGARTERVVVAIPTFNEERHIETVLRTLAAEKPEVRNLEIMVVDGGSRDSTVAVVQALTAEFPFIRVACHPGQWISAAVNHVAAVSAGHAEIMIRCDAHADYPPRFIARLLETLENTGATSVVVPMDSVGHQCLEKAVAWASDSLVGSGGSAHRGGKVSGFIDHGHHAAFRLDAYIAQRGYDEALTCNEDAELDNRLLAAGGRIYLNADIRIQYRPRGTFKGLWKQYYKYGRGRAINVKRHPGTIRFRQVALPLHLGLLDASVLLFCVTQSMFFLVWPALYAAILTGLSLGTAFLRRSPCGLLTGPAAFVMHTSWALGYWRAFLFLKPPAFSSGILPA